MPLSNSTSHTRNLCGIIEAWLLDNGYPLFVEHTDLPNKTWCTVYGKDLGQNPISIGYIEPKSVLFIGNDPYDVQRLNVYDDQFFEKLTNILSFTKP